MVKIMNPLPNDITKVILDILPITGKRSLIRCNKYFNKFYYLMERYENDFYSMIYKTNNFFCHMIPLSKYYDLSCLNLMKSEKYLLEIIWDGSHKLMLDNYLIRAKRILDKYPGIYFHIGNNGLFNMIKLLITNNINSNHEAVIMHGAAIRGDMEILKWTRKKGITSDYVCEYLALSGNLEILKWAKKKGFHWDFDTCANAAKNGNLEILKWARENGCTWNYETCVNAAKNGHLEILKWAIENGCDLDYKVYQYASENGHLEILKWVHENNYL
jgi:hypothetical protein